MDIIFSQLDGDTMVLVKIVLVITAMIVANHFFSKWPPDRHLLDNSSTVFAIVLQQPTKSRSK
jgi:hypothetical protein